MSKGSRILITISLLTEFRNPFVPSFFLFWPFLFLETIFHIFYISHTNLLKLKLLHITNKNSHYISHCPGYTIYCFYCQYFWGYSNGIYNNSIKEVKKKTQNFEGSVVAKNLILLIPPEWNNWCVILLPSNLFSLIYASLCV